MQRSEIAPDFRMLIKLFNRVYKTAMAYYFTGDEYYAERTATRIRKFFLDEATGMLPSLLYAQLKPGIEEFGASTVRPVHCCELSCELCCLRMHCAVCGCTVLGAMCRTLHVPGCVLCANAVCCSGGRRDAWA
jgi:hypothetical protein